MALTTTQRTGLRNRLGKASGPAIRDAMPRLMEHWRVQSWLCNKNIYRQNVIDLINAGGVLEHAHLSEYVAASAVVHSFDGWSYLSRALEAEMAGDPDSARHLGYYAELRAAMSMLASGGIGVFDRQHVVVRDSQECEIFKSDGTHVFAWQALEIWADLGRWA